ncbi:MAG: hypothetical protein J07HQW2_00062 [Haloquadratum walsbyi J07HQW2]|uniref:Uncharacterized protein n=1 Tax=Haloquadratum walsbyi J07HQW2 TaxID=1238425 RepID=U1MTM0_9EURY|nr:MAG: hypothetical protein J07HQW2_00062 [Haloquadratum walsbyi J07HQW2]
MTTSIARPSACFLSRPSTPTTRSCSRLSSCHALIGPEKLKTTSGTSRWVTTERSRRSKMSFCGRRSERPIKSARTSTVEISLSRSGGPSAPARMTRSRGRGWSRSTANNRLQRLTSHSELPVTSRLSKASRTPLRRSQDRTMVSRASFSGTATKSHPAVPHTTGQHQRSLWALQQR